jgi:hypothetical protein
VAGAGVKKFYSNPKPNHQHQSLTLIKGGDARHWMVGEKEIII